VAGLRQRLLGLAAEAAAAASTAQAVDARSRDRGLAMHLTNPEAASSWLATVTVGIPAGASPHLAWVVVGGSHGHGDRHIGGYALAFSTLPRAALMPVPAAGWKACWPPRSDVPGYSCCAPIPRTLTRPLLQDPP